MKKKLLLSLLVAGMASSGLYADCDTGCCEKTEREGKNCFSLYAAGGGSFTRCADICVDTTDNYWPDVPEGYDSDLGNTGFLEYGLGYEWCDWLSFMATGQYRNTMDYCKQQTGIPLYRINPDLTLTDSGTRFFELDASSFMFSVLFDATNLAGCEDWPIDILIGGGIGFTHFDVFDFHLELDSVSEDFPADVTFPAPKRVRDIGTSVSNNDFAAQAFIGLQYTACNWIKVGAGYRFFHGGDFCTNDYVLAGRNDGEEFAVDPWQGRLQANEIYLNVYCSY